VCVFCDRFSNSGGVMGGVYVNDLYMWFSCVFLFCFGC
jgi:hypothetical protein